MLWFFNFVVWLLVMGAITGVALVFAVVSSGETTITFDAGIIPFLLIVCALLAFAGPGQPTL